MQVLIYVCIFIRIYIYIYIFSYLFNRVPGAGALGKHAGAIPGHPKNELREVKIELRGVQSEGF